MPRINLDGIFIKIAKTISEASYAKDRQVGAIIVKDNNVISMGYNGTAAGRPNETQQVEGGKLRTKAEVIHAESNAIIKARGDLRGSTMYCTLAPCFECSKLILQSGISRLVYLEEWKKADGRNFLAESGVKVSKA